MVSKITVNFAERIKVGLLVENYDEMGQLLHAEVFSYDDIKNFLDLYKDYDPEKTDPLSCTAGNCVYRIREIDVNGVKNIVMEKAWPIGNVRRQIKKSLFDCFMAELKFFYNGRR